MAPLGMAPHTDARATADPLDALVGHSAAMQEVFRLIEQVAATTLTVLITGETGTGKELVARAVHGCSDRSRGPFIAVNGSAIPAGLIESEFFGHARGAFTGALTARRGLMEELVGERCSSTKSPRWTSRCRPSCSAHSRTGARDRWAPTSRSPSTSG